MDELIERLEKATGPDRLLDAMILQAFTPERHDAFADHVGFLVGGKHEQPLRAPEFTKSVDAALALVERVLPEWGGGRLSWSAGGKYPVFRTERSYPTNLEVSAEGHTRPLAILIALLKARALNSESSNGH